CHVVLERVGAADRDGDRVPARWARLVGHLWRRRGRREDRDREHDDLRHPPAAGAVPDGSRADGHDPWRARGSHWDGANNLVAQIDHRLAEEWPAGHRPQSVHVRHDALYRVVGAELDYTQVDGRRTPED